MAEPVAAYDTIGHGYRAHRRPDPQIEAQVWAALGAGSLVNVGAGAGSYEPTDRDVVAVEPSAVMRAQRTPTAAPCVAAEAEALPFADAAFDAALAVLTVHHWTDPDQGLRELARVARRQVVLTFDPALNEGCWLVDDYLPEILDLPASQPPSPDSIAEMLGGGRIEVVRVPADCTDGFLWAYWNRPSAYLDPGVRGAISAIAQLPERVVARGTAALEADLASGAWAARNGQLLDQTSIDGGFRLVVCGPGGG